MNKRISILYILLLFTTTVTFGFTFTATPTPETCAGNGTITFTSSNADPNGSIVYIVYKLPDVTTPYATVNSNLLNGLTAGMYKIVAKETVGSTTSQQETQVEVTDNKSTLAYSIQSLQQACSNTTNISVNVSSGIAQSYEIFSGPIVFPSQASPTFTGLAVGVYKIRVFDICGVGVVKTFTVNQNAAGITISPPTFTNTIPPSCNFTVATNIITPTAGTVIGYPLVITYTIHPPGGGAPIVQVVNLASGNATSQNLVETIPDYVNQNYDYDLTIVDACNSTYTQNFPVVKDITLGSTIIQLPCDQNYFSLQVANYTPPFTLNFTSFPAGFNPTTYNSNYPGPYNQDTIVFGDQNNVAPYGIYTVSVVDACGRTTSITFSILSIIPVPTVNTANNGCLTNTGSISITIPFYPLLTAIITAAPPGFPQPLPYDVSSSIDASGSLNFSTVPLGDYVIQVTDTCPIVIPPISCTVPVYVNQGVSVDVRPGCDLLKTSLELTCANGKLTTVTITAAPLAFGQTYPYDVSANIISNGKLYLDNLPAGSYSFATLDECGFSNTITVNATGYAITTSTFSLQPNCGSFNIPLNFVSNGTTNESYWLQKLINPVTDTWASPDYTPGNGALYVNGTVPDATNSLPLLNNATNFNLSYNGTFRIVRSFFSYNNGKSFNMGTVTDINKSCIEILSPTLNFQQSLEITNVTRMPCTTSGNLDVALLANGTAPLIYSILTKDGLPFPVNNGTSNIFYNLPPGLYTFQVEDSCGNSTPITRDVSALLSIVTITKPQDLLLCKTNITGNEVFDLTQQSATILSSQSPTDYTLTYYATMADAMANTNAIANLTTFDPATNPATIYARLIFNELPTCYEITTFDVIVGQIPKINLQPSYLKCAQFSITLDASPNNLPISTYAWSNGVSATTPTVTITQPGVTNVHLEVTNTYGTLSCTNQTDTTVTLSEVPKIDHFETVDWTETENSITVFTSNTGDYEYSLDDMNYQSSPLFSNLTPGLYTVYVRDRNGCGTSLQEIWLLYYKRFFTPNGDGINDTWKIDNSKYETNLRIYIYDRYGKLMTSLNSLEDGWDGMYNGQQMFSTDYWFEVFRQDGRIHKGHFTLKR